MVTAVAAWSIWGGDMFPAADPTGGILTFPFPLMHFSWYAKGTK